MAEQPKDSASSGPEDDAESAGRDAAKIGPHGTIPISPSDLPNLGATIDMPSLPTMGPAGPRADQTMLHESHAPEAAAFEIDANPYSDTLERPGPLPPEPPAPGPTRGFGESAPQPGQPRPTVPGYEILGELGRGGMGVVYRARQIRLNRIVALKMVLAGAHAGGQQLTRFLTEAETVAKLQHPNIVQIHEVGDHEGLPYFSLEFVPGGTLAEAIEGKPRPPREAALLVEQLARAMDVAHRHGVIHRDLKSANVLLTPDGTPKITDFGLAKSLESDSGLTKSGTLMGTPSYMSPEQARGEHDIIGPLSDLYSLGAMLYELLTGRPPFLAPSMLETIYQVRNQEPVPPRRLQPKVPKDLETICLKCLQKEPAKRYADCEELAEDLRRFRGGEAIRARPVGRIERTWRWCRRNPRTAGLTAIISVLVAAVVVSLAVMGVRLSREREAVAETRKVATERIDQATEAVSRGDYHRATDLLGWSDPFLEHNAELQDVRARRDTLRNQVSVYAEFKQLLDDARFSCRFGARSEKERGRQTCARLLALYDQIEAKTGPAADGLPPLSLEQHQLFQEDAFESFLVASLVVRELAEAAGEPARHEAARQAIAWLDRAETILPGTRVLYVQRAASWGMLGDRAADQADIKRAEAIAPTSAVDRFWRGFAEHLRGEDARRRGDTKAATEHFRKEVAEYSAFLQLRPDHFWGYFNWAVCLVNLNDLDDAAIGFTTCIRIRPDFPWPYNNRGTVHLRQQRYDLAILDYTAALTRNPDYIEALTNRGTAYAAMGKPDLAFADIGRALELNADYAPAYAKRIELYRGRKQYPEALIDFERLIALSADKAPVFLQRAELYQAMNQGSDALADFDRAIALAPKNANAIFARAGLHFARKDYLKARADYTQVITLVPGAAIAYGNRAIINWLYLKEFDAALKDWEQMARLEPKNPEPYRFIGAVRLGRGEYAGALDAFQKALDRKPDHVEVIWMRAQIYLWQGKPKEALAELDPLAARLAPDKPETLNLRGEVYRFTGEPDRAAADYRRMIGLRPKDPEAYVSLALVLDQQNKPKEAAACYDQLVTADPKSPVPYLRRAAFSRDHNQFAQALADCDAAAGIDPKSALPELTRASVEAAQGKYREAVARAETALKNAPKDDGHVLYTAACVWSLASRAAEADMTLAKAYANRAAELLGATLGKGFHDLLFPEHNRMTTDPALTPIRSHPRVLELLAGRP